MKNNTRTEFLLEEYKQNWSYIHQCEEVRLRQFQLFLLIFGAFVYFLAYLLRGQPKPLTLLTGDYAAIVISIACVLAVVLFCILLFVFFQKRGYETYRHRNRVIQWELAEYCGPPAPSPRRWYALSPKSAFTWWLATLLAIWLALVVFIIYLAVA